MAIIAWKHKKSKTNAINEIKNTFKTSGYEESVTWVGDKAEARYGPFATILYARGQVTEDLVIIDECSGLASGLVLERCRELLSRLFPEGEPSV